MPAPINFRWEVKILDTKCVAIIALEGRIQEVELGG
jgi:hypothetical protein